MSDFPFDDNLVDDNLSAAMIRAENAIEQTRDDVRAYIPSVARRLMFTFGVPVFIVLLVSTLGALALTYLLPLTAVKAVMFVINIIILIYGWRFMEARYKGTAAFVMYTRYSRTRRDLEAMLKKTPEGSDVTAAELDQQREAVLAVADAFMATMRDMGAQPITR